MAHVIWDWNGTLFHDVEIILEALNRTGEKWGWGPVPDVATLRAIHKPSYRQVYETLRGIPFSDVEWDQVVADWHIHYADHVHKAGLASDAAVCLNRLSESGWTQSLLSMLSHDALSDLVSETEVLDFFVHVQGRTVPVGPKSDLLGSHLDALEQAGITKRPEVVMIGDMVDDAQAAADWGLQCVLTTTGMQSHQMLETAGVPVCDSLTEALDMAEELV